VGAGALVVVTSDKIIVAIKGVLLKGEPDLRTNAATVLTNMTMGSRLPRVGARPMVHKGFANASVEIYKEVRGPACLPACALRGMPGCAV
jgi:hypothetical protein